MPYELHFLNFTTAKEYVVIVTDFVPEVGDTVVLESPDVETTFKATYKVVGRCISYYQTESPGAGFVKMIAIYVS